MHKNTIKVDCGHRVGTKRMRCDGVGAVLKSRSKDEKYRNQKGLDKDSRLKEESTDNGIYQAKCYCEVPNCVSDNGIMSFCDKNDTDTQTYVVISTFLVARFT